MAVTRRSTTGRAGAAALGLATAVALLPGVTAGAQEGDGPQVVRIAGDDRYETAASISDAFMSGVDRVFLATGETFPDALAAGPVAGQEGYPILLVERERIPAATAAALERLEPGGITVLGGTVAVSDAVQREARRFTSGPVDRLAGENRYETASAVVDHYVDPGVPVAYVATGRGFADALAGGPAAIVGDGPMLLVEPDGIPVSTRTTLERLRPERLVVLGGTQAVSRAVEEDLEDIAGVSVQRMAGADRFGTAATIAREVFDGPESTVYMTTGLSFPDALSGGVVAGLDGAPLVTVDPRCVPDVVLAEIERMAPDMLVVLGGPQAVSDDAADLVACSEVAEPRASTIQTGLDAPWDVVFTPDGRTFLTERDSGVVSERFSDGGLRRMLTLPVDATGEGGLLGLAVSPTYDQDGWLYAFYTAASDQRIVRFDADGRNLQTVVSGLPDGGPGHGNHFAGRIEFGPDGMLYVGVGDVGDPSASQDVGQLAGKILRYTPEGGIPGDNPFGGSPVYAYGFRDPQGIGWDAAGRMYASEFGPNQDDEVNRVVPGGNYGWPVVTGSDGGNPDFVDPIVVRQPPVASWSGASVLVDGDIPGWEGDLFVAALRGQRLYRVDLDGAGDVAGVEELFVGQYGRLRHVTQAPDGSLWMLTSNCDGRGACPPDGDRIVRYGR